MRWIAGVVLAGGLVWAQAPAGPVVNPRGVLNAFTLQPAPSVVGRGALIRIGGLNLGPVEGVRAQAVPWPTQLGDPPVEVVINGRPAPVGEAAPDHVVAQVPWDAAPGLARVVVRRGGAASRPAMVTVDRSRPAVKTSGNSGWGAAAGAGSAGTLALSAGGLGPTDARVENGSAGPQEAPAQPRDDVRVYVGGLPAKASASLSSERVGEFDIVVEPPAGAQPGDVIAVYAANRGANPVTWQAAAGAEVKFVPLPDGAPELRSLTGSDLRGAFVAANGARDDAGCYPSLVFDAAAGTATPVEGCLTAANKNQPSPFVAALDGTAIAALAGGGSQVRIFNPALAVDLGAEASLLASAGGGDFQAVIPGTPPRRLVIDGQTGEVREPAAAPAGAGPGGAFVPKVDLGGGLTHVLAVTAVGDNLFSVLVADDAEQPKSAKMAVVNRAGEVQGTEDFPEGWAPIVAPRAPATRAAAAAAGPRVGTFFDAAQRAYYVVASNAGNTQHGIVLFGETPPAQLLALPDGWFAAACTASLNLYTLELSRRAVLIAGNSPEIAFEEECPGTGFVLLDLNRKQLDAVALPGQGQFNVGRGASNDLNDFIYGSNTDPSKNNTADTLFVLDGVNGSVTQLALPAGMTSFGALLAVRDLNALISLAQNRQPGDAGLVYFDLESMEVRTFPVPEGFARVGLVGVFPATRKLVARGFSREGSQLLIYDLVTNDLALVANPEGVVGVGQAPPRPGAPAAPPLVAANVKANTVAAVGYNAEGKQAGLMVVRIP